MYVFARYGWNALEQNPWKAENMYKVDARETQLKIAFYFKKKEEVKFLIFLAIEGNPSEQPRPNRGPGGWRLCL